MLIIPAIDLRDGRCVRLAQGDYGREKVYSDDPVEVARSFEGQGAEWLHVVDLDGARSGQLSNLDQVVRIVMETSLKVEFGGGIRSLEAANRVLGHGISRVVVGTKLVKDPDLARAMFAELGDQMIAGIDSRDGKVAVAGWTEGSDVDAVGFAMRMEVLGARRIIFTDIAKDGMLSGPNTALLSQVRRAVTIPVIQSGGIGSLDDIRSLEGMGDEKPEAVIVGRALYEGCFTVSEAITVTQKN